MPQRGTGTLQFLSGHIAHHFPQLARISPTLLLPSSSSFGIIIYVYIFDPALKKLQS